MATGRLAGLFSNEWIRHIMPYDPGNVGRRGRGAPRNSGDESGVWRRRENCPGYNPSYKYTTVDMLATKPGFRQSPDIWTVSVALDKARISGLCQVRSSKSGLSGVCQSPSVKARIVQFVSTISYHFPYDMISHLSPSCLGAHINRQTVVSPLTS